MAVMPPTGPCPHGVIDDICRPCTFDNALAAPPQKYGHLTVESALARGYLCAKVFLNGVEEKDTRELDDIEGWIIRYKLDAAGHKYVDLAKDEAAVEKVYGDVRYVPNPFGVPGEMKDWR